MNINILDDWGQDQRVHFLNRDCPKITYQKKKLNFIAFHLKSISFLSHVIFGQSLFRKCTLWSCPQSSRITLKSFRPWILRNFGEIQMGIIDTTNVSWSTEKAEMQTNPYPVLNPNPKPGFWENFQTQNPYPNPSLIFQKPCTRTQTHV